MKDMAFDPINNSIDIYIQEFYLHVLRLKPHPLFVMGDASNPAAIRSGIFAFVSSRIFVNSDSEWV